MDAPLIDDSDIYSWLTKQQGWRERSAFKLLYIDHKFEIFKGVKRVVDLCSAPGTWSQVLSRKLYAGTDIAAQGSSSFETTPNDVKIVSVDLDPMEPVPGVVHIHGDVSNLETAKIIIPHFGGLQVDLVVCDVPLENVGIHNVDIYLQAPLLLGALRIATNLLKRGGTFVATILRSIYDELLITQIQTVFQDVVITKPFSSYGTEEAIIVCRNYNPPEHFDPTLSTNFVFYQNYYSPRINRNILPYLASDEAAGFCSVAKRPAEDAAESMDIDEPIIPSRKRTRYEQ